MRNLIVHNAKYSLAALAGFVLLTLALPAWVIAENSTDAAAGSSSDALPNVPDPKQIGGEPEGIVQVANLI